MLRYVVGISILTLALLIIRYFANGRISKRLQYSLWILIPLYMLVAPIYSIDITVPAKEIIVNEQVEIVEEPNVVGNSGAIQVNPDLVPAPLGDMETIVEVANSEDTEVVNDSRSINWPATIRNFISLVEVILIAFVVLYNLGFVIYCNRKRQFIEINPAFNLKVYRLNHSSSPFLLGNNIYLSDKVANGDMARYAICHEYCHYKHLDPMWTDIRFIVLALNWYNPLIWYAFVIVEQDCELACDESVLVLLGEDKNIEYGKVLLTLLADKASGKHAIYLSTAMNGRSKKFMKDRITNIKYSKKHGIIPVAITVSLSLVMAGCSLVEFKEETKDSVSDTEQIEITESVDQEIETSKATDASKTPETTEYVDESDIVFPTESYYQTEFIDIPSVNTSLEDGYYTVAMTPVNVPTDDGKSTCMVYPWTQYEVDQEYIDALEIGQTIDLSEYDGYGIVTVKDIAVIGMEPVVKLGTSYTGEITNLTTSIGFMNFYHVEGSDTWKLFAESDMPVIQYSEPVRLVLSDSYVIYDASSLFSSYSDVFVEMTQEEIDNVFQFKDTTLTEGIIDDICDFWLFADNSGISTYTNTVIRIENNEVTEVYFWYAS